MTEEYHLSITILEHNKTWVAMFAILGNVILVLFYQNVIAVINIEYPSLRRDPLIILNN